MPTNPQSGRRLLDLGELSTQALEEIHRPLTAMKFHLDPSSPVSKEAVALIDAELDERWAEIDAAREEKASHAH